MSLEDDRMEYFDEEKNNNEMEQRAKQKFIENYKKQLRFCKIILSSVFCGIGGLFLLLGIIFIGTESDSELTGSFLGVGGLFLIMGLLFLVIFSFIKVNDKTYDRMKKYQNKFGVMNIYSLSSTVTVLNEQVSELTNKVEELEKELERVKRDNRLNK